MAYLISGTCSQCAFQTGELLDRGASLYCCPTCRAIATVEFLHRRFDMPSCRMCCRTFSSEDRVTIGDGDFSQCPSCQCPTLRWLISSHVRLRLAPEPEVVVGEIVHGTIRNTVFMQRLDIVRPYHRGRISQDHPPWEDGTTVEARVLSCGGRSVDVHILGSITDPSRPRP
jgi:hypothetical protein